jgi:hypothetical protein
MYAAIRQAKAKSGMAEELTRRIKEGAIPIISDVDGFMAYYVVYAPDDTVTASRGSRGGKPACHRLDRAKSCPPPRWTSHSGGRPSDRAYVGVTKKIAIIYVTLQPSLVPDRSHSQSNASLVSPMAAWSEWTKF